MINDGINAAVDMSIEIDTSNDDDDDDGDGHQVDYPVGCYGHLSVIKNTNLMV